MHQINILDKFIREQIMIFKEIFFAGLKYTI